MAGVSTGGRLRRERPGILQASISVAGSARRSPAAAAPRLRCVQWRAPAAGRGSPLQDPESADTEGPRPALSRRPAPRVSDRGGLPVSYTHLTLPTSDLV